jgi:hypothetical protein
MAWESFVYRGLVGVRKEAERIRRPPRPAESAVATALPSASAQRACAASARGTRPQPGDTRSVLAQRAQLAGLCLLGRG